MDAFVLLSVDGSSRRVRRVARLAHRARPELPGYSEALGDLERRGLVRTRLMRRPTTTAEARVDGLKGSLFVLIRGQDRLEDDEAELLVMVARAEVLKVNPSDALRARHRISALHERCSELPVVAAIRDELGVDTAAELAERIFPTRADYDIGDFDPGMTGGVGAVMYGQHS